MEKFDLQFKSIPQGKVLGIKETSIILDVPYSTVRALERAGRIKRKQGKKGYVYDENSLKSFVNSFIRSDYYSISEATEVLKDNGITDTFQAFNSESGKGRKCKYNRYTTLFPMSPKQLLNRGYLEKDADIKPTMITKKSMVHLISIASTQLKGK